ncbi:hypothetical protein PUN28_001573 [Cardiocondyla obscurior]|uniref:Mevalonate kinase n=1 Tax=Cardiocondyla obscurior TaxID=286306 RepID=A0AAW2H5N2_9HYME
MIKFEISAPGKVILFGEHAVVYGKTAVATSLNLRTTLRFTELTSSADFKHSIKIEFPNINLLIVVPLSAFLNYFFNDNFTYLPENSVHLHNHVKDFVESIADLLKKNDDKDIINRQKSSLRAFFYLLSCTIFNEELNIKDTSFHVYVSTNFSVGAGLGSSASFAVCLAGCFLHWSNLQKDKRNTFISDLDKISKYALDSEKIMHESPSGIDNSICTYGSMIRFENRKLVDMLQDVPKLNILLVNSGIVRNTKDLVKRVADVKNTSLTTFNSILDSIDDIAKNGWKTFNNMSSEGEDSKNPKWYSKLKTLIDTNQKLLHTLGVSHTQLDTICQLANKHSYSSKLTGAGGGGYVFVLLPPNEDEQSIISLINDLIEHGFDKFVRTSLGGNGVRLEE